MNTPNALLDAIVIERATIVRSSSRLGGMYVLVVAISLLTFVVVEDVLPGVSIDELMELLPCFLPIPFIMITFKPYVEFNIKITLQT
jgi:hypothetical protein